MKKKLNLIIIMMALVAIFAISAPCKFNFVFAANDFNSQSQASQSQVDDTQKNPLHLGKLTPQNQDVAENDADKINGSKKIGFKYMFFKFCTAMLGVLVSILVIFFGLKIYKKMALKNSSRNDFTDYDNTLETPQDFKTAINMFLEKTDKK